MSSNGFADWFFGAAYLAIAALCIVTFVRRGRRAPTAELVAWVALAAVLVVMALARWEGAAGDLTTHMRRIARHDGWWRDRRRVQAPIAVLVLAAWAVGVAWIMTHHSVLDRPRRLIAVTCSLVMFAAVRAISLHGIDSLMRYRLFGTPQFGNLVELALVLVGVHAAVEQAVLANESELPT